MHFTPKLDVILTYNYTGLPLKIQIVFIPKHLTKTPLHLPLKIYSLIFLLHFLTLSSRQNMTTPKPMFKGLVNRKFDNNDLDDSS